MSNRRAGEGLAKHLAVIVFVFFGIALARSANAGTITVAWDLMNDPAVTGYRVFVGTASGNYSQTFDVPADKEFFIFRNAFMGVRYYFAVAAQFEDSRIGARSIEVSAVGTRTVAGGGVRLEEPTAAVSECGVDCFVVSDVAQRLGEISALAVANDGTLFAVEDGRRVLVLRDGVAMTAFDADPGTVLRDIAVDPQFHATGRVFVSLLRLQNQFEGDLEVLRLRYLGGSLGEPSTIVTGPAVALGARAPLAIGDGGLIYVAVPRLLNRHPYSSAILAFGQDGRLPPGQPAPVVATTGLDDPADMTWDAQSRSLWLLGRGSGLDAQLLAISPAAGSAAPVSDILGSGESASAVAVSSGGGRRLLVGADVDIIEVTPERQDRVRIPLDAYGAPAAMAASGRSRYVAVKSEGPAGPYRVVKVEAGTLTP